MKKLHTVLVLSLLCAGITDNRTYSMTSLEYADLALKVGTLIVLAWGLNSISELLCDMRNIQLEQLEQNNSISNDNANISYLQLVDEHVDNCQRDTHVHTAFSVSVPKELVIIESCDLIDDCTGDHFEDDDFEDID